MAVGCIEKTSRIVINSAKSGYRSCVVDLPLWPMRSAIAKRHLWCRSVVVVP
ncbi:hypothetical protein IG631_09801 [Alternaria alternata]|nr:hypothetical protein IG631_09801 [Alternaria alternata]